MLVHVFHPQIAKKFGILEAVLFYNICYWVEHNRAKNINCKKGEYWTYNSKRAFAELFPYATERQIDYALNKLRDKGILKTDNFNKKPYDKTLWYTLTSYGHSLAQNCEMDETNLSIGTNNNV